MARPRRSAIDALLSPRSVAVVGASPTGNVGRTLIENLRLLGYEGTVFPVNPRYDEVLGHRCYPSIEALPSAPEAVAAAVRIDLVPGILATAFERGARAAVVPGGGFSETGRAALDAQREIGRLGESFDVAVAGPNCMGVISPVERAALYIGGIAPTVLTGRVGVISQSGSVIEAMVNMGPRIGFSALVSCGTEVVTTVGDYLRHFAADDRTGVACVFLEGFRDPAAFVEGARAMRAAGKPLVVLKAGRSEEAQAAIAAHSGTLAGADEVVTGLLRQLGAIRVDDLDEMIEVAELLGHGRRPPGRRLMAVTDSGGESQLAADAVRETSLELPAPSRAMVERLRAVWPHFSFIGNPVDPWGVDPDFEHLYREIAAAMAAEDVDTVAVALDKVTTWAGEGEVELGVAGAEALIEACRATGRFGVFFTIHATQPAHERVRTPLREAGIPLMHGLREAIRAIDRAAWWEAWRPRSAPAGGPTARGPRPNLMDPGPVLSEGASREVLAAFGVPLVPGELAATADEAAAAAERLGYPVALKADVPGVAHKLAAGLVELGAASEGAVRAGFDRLMGRARELGREPRGVLVERMASGVEVICGMRRDPVFGPVVLLGVGGSLTEVLREVAVRVCPPAPEDLEEMPGECAVGRLLERAGADPAPLHATLSGLARLAEIHPEVREVDVNPMFVGRDGGFAADALVVLDDSGTQTLRGA